MTTTRRDMLKMTAAVPVLAIVPLGPIPDLTPAKTLESLAAEGKYVSATHYLPLDVLSTKWEFSLNGVVQDNRYGGTLLQEVYAPGDHTGWAVVYVKVYKSDGSRSNANHTKLIHGNWRIKRLGHDSSRHRA